MKGVYKKEGSHNVNLQYLRKKRRNADKVSSTNSTYLPFLSLNFWNKNSLYKSKNII